MITDKDQPKSSPNNETSERKLMIVDDLRDFAESIAEVLEWEGYETRIACTPSDAIKTAESFDYDVVLIDIRLGNTSGIDLIAELKAFHPQAQFIIMTAYAAVETAIEAIHSGAYAYLRKPLINEELFATLDRCFQAIRLQTEKEIAETELRKREFEYRRLFDNLPDIFYQTDIQGNLLLVSPSIQSILGYTPAEVIGKNFFRDFFKDTIKGESLLGKMKDMVCPERFQCELIAKNGSGVWVSASTGYYKDLKGKVLGIEGIAHDITESKRVAEERLNLATAIEQAAELIFITDTEGDIQYVNPSFVQVTGYTEKEVINKNPRLLKSGTHDDAFYKQLWNTITQGNVWRGRLVNKKKSGVLYQEEATITPIRDNEGQIINYVAVKRDITKEAMLEKQLIQAQKMEAIGTLAGGIAHDFNNILSSIMGYTELALLELEKQGVKARHLDRVLKSSYRAKDLVNQILYFSRRDEYELKLMDLGKATQDTVKLLRASLPTTISLKHDINAKERTILADPTQIDQVLMNICTNAGQAMLDNGGLLQLTLDEAADDVNFSLQFPDNIPHKFLRLSIQDTGNGIPPDVKEKIFDPYFTTKKKGEGTGLGLAIVHGIVQRHNGYITVNSESGKGTCFRIYLPHAEGAMDEITSIDVKSVPVGNEKILLVDDEQDITRAIQKILHFLGYNVSTFNDSVKALEAFQSHPTDYDVIITDMTMPVLTGDQLAKDIKKTRPDIPVLLCTGYNEKITDQTAKHIGIDELLIKPVTTKTLAHTLRSVLDKRAERKEPPYD